MIIKGARIKLYAYGAYFILALYVAWCCYYLCGQIAFQTPAEQAAPTSGATMNSHSCDSAVPPSNSAGPMLRAGLTDVPVIGIHTMCMSTSVNPMASPPRLPAPFSLSVAPSTTKTKMKVNTASAINA